MTIPVPKDPDARPAGPIPTPQPTPGDGPPAPPVPGPEPPPYPPPAPNSEWAVAAGRLAALRDLAEHAWQRWMAGDRQGALAAVNEAMPTAAAAAAALTLLTSTERQTGLTGDVPQPEPTPTSGCDR
ncbi:hypothetical protein ABT263_21370 [Kitasatospora sp. NPDC001603]|uniref:hypothetical protein n=1 Tax=Kitasatospora sp. NPDC001603 TaxID=3154388 RepID=UPI0033328AA9